MRTLAIRFLALTICATPLVALAVVSPVNAATSDGKHVKKHAKKPQRSPVVNNARSSNPGYPSTSEDPDRKAAGGGY
jgi:hypothetical protein